MPDASIMIELADILNISVNELLSGEIIKEKEYMNEAEKNLIELKESNDEYARKLLYFENIIGYIFQLIEVFSFLCTLIGRDI